MPQQVMTLADAGELFDGPHATPTRREAGPYFLNISSLNDGRLDLSQSDHVSIEDFQKWTRRVQPQEGDLLFSYETRLGEAALMPAGVKACLGRRMALFRPDRTVADPRYLLYYYLGPEFQAVIERNTIHGATVNRIPLASMGSWPVAMPPLHEQLAIAEVLGALDDKIAANARVVATADALAATRLLAMLEVSGEQQPLSALAEFVNGRAFTKGATGTGRVVIRIAELNSGIGGSTVYNDIDVPEHHLARPGDLLFAWSGSLTVHRWFRPEAIVNQHIFKVIPADGYPLWCVNGVLRRKLSEFQAIAANKATTMGHIQRRHLDEEVPVPTRAQIQGNGAVMTALWQRALAAEVESLQLEQVRDTLLPQLMSGKIRVKDAEDMVSEAV
jgi:type I restriction enzyme S subunit